MAVGKAHSARHETDASDSFMAGINGGKKEYARGRSKAYSFYRVAQILAREEAFHFRITEVYGASCVEGNRR